MKRLILSLCDRTGEWSRPYKEAGYEVIRVELSEGHDVRTYQLSRNKVWGVLAAPPCTVFAISGARWTRTPTDMLHGLSIVDACLRIAYVTKPQWWALENPIGTLHRFIGEPTLTFQPYWYGDPYTKRTCLWGRFNRPKRNDVHPEDGSKMIKHGGGSEDTKIKRSTTPAGFAKAFFEANP